MDEPVTVAEFEERLAAIGLRGEGSGVPKKPRDRQIVFRSVAQSLEPERIHSESEVNAALQLWLSGFGTGFDVDHVTLRRHLVDAKFLIRDAYGSGYQVHVSGGGLVEFDPEVAHIDAGAVVEAARERAAVKKAEALRSRS